MDMEEYFDKTQEDIKEIIKQVEKISVSPYHPKTLEVKKKALEVLKELFNEFEF